jgi:predicted permease
MNNVEIMAVLFAIVIVGFIAGRLGYMGGDFDRRLSGLIIDFTCPALILSSTMTGTLPDRRLILPLLAISVLTYVLLTAAALWLPPLLTRRREDRGVVGFALMFGNVGFIGYPVVAAIFGQQAVFYTAVLNVVNTFAVFTVGTMLLAGRGAGTPHSRREWVRLLVSSPMVAAYLSMVIVALGIDNIPVVISQPLTYIGNITVPAALLIIGSSLSQLPLHTMLGNRTVYVTAIFRLALLPLAVYAVTSLLGFSHLVVSINTVVIAMPVATYGTILCLKLGRDTALITELTFITTLIAVCSIPVVAMLL